LHGLGQLLGIVDVLAIDTHDHVPRLEAGLRRRRTGDHRADNRSDGREMKLRRLKMTQEPGFMQLTP
jgi:hypothetical protein